MTDEQAIQLANLLGLYGVECVREGMSREEVRETTISEVINDLADSLPGHPASRLHISALNLT